MKCTAGRSLSIGLAFALLVFLNPAAQAQNGNDFFDLAFEAQEAGQTDRAITLYTRAIESGDLDIESLAFTHNNRANSHRANGNFDLARQDYNEAILLDPQYAVAYNNRGSVHRQTGEFDLARQDYDKAILLDPQHANAFGNRGLLRLDNLSDSEGAIEDLDSAIRLDPRISRHYEWRGDAYFDLGNRPRAIKNYHQALGLETNIGEHRLEKMLFRGGSFFLSIGEYALAVEEFDRLSEFLDADDIFQSILQSSRGIAFYFLGDKAAADAAFEAANRGIESDLPDSIFWYLANTPGGRPAEFYLATGEETAFENLEFECEEELGLLYDSIDECTDERPISGNAMYDFWPAPLADLFRGERTPDDILTNTADRSTNDRIEALYFVGQYELLQGNTAEAKRLFEQLVGLNSDPSMYLAGARSELARLTAN